MGLKTFLFNISCTILICIFFVFQPIDYLSAQGLETLFNQALDSALQAEFEKALSLWDQFLQESPENPAALSNRGNIRLILGNAEGAIEDQSKAIKLQPDEIDPYINRGIAEENLGRWDAAKNDYKLALEMKPNDAMVLYNLGSVSVAEGNWLAAEDFYNRASLIEPDLSIAQSSKALVKYQLGEVEEAELELRNIIRRYPMDADARAALTALLWVKGSTGEAESHWAAVNGLDGNYKDSQWLINFRRWPPKPISDLMAFLELGRS